MEKKEESSSEVVETESVDKIEDSVESSSEKPTTPKKRKTTKKTTKTTKKTTTKKPKSTKKTSNKTDVDDKVDDKEKKMLVEEKLASIKKSDKSLKNFPKAFSKLINTVEKDDKLSYVFDNITKDVMSNINKESTAVELYKEDNNEDTTEDMLVESDNPVNTVVVNHNPTSATKVIRKNHSRRPNNANKGDLSQKLVEGEYINESGNRVIPMGGKPYMGEQQMTQEEAMQNRIGVEEDGIHVPMEDLNNPEAIENILNGNNMNDIPMPINNNIPLNAVGEFSPPGDKFCYVYFKLRLSSFTMNSQVLDMAFCDNHGRSFYGQITDIRWQDMDVEILKNLRSIYPEIYQNVLPKELTQQPEEESKSEEDKKDEEEVVNDWVIKGTREVVVNALCMWLKKDYLDAGKVVQFVGDLCYFEFAILILYLQGGASVVSNVKDISIAPFDINQLIGDHMIINKPEDKSYKDDIKPNYIPVLAALSQQRRNIAKTELKYTIDLLNIVSDIREIHNMYMQFDRYDVD